MAGYEEAAEDELLRLAREEGLEAAEASVVIEQDSRNPDFGKVKKIVLKFRKEDEAESAPAEFRGRRRRGPDYAGRGGESVGTAG